MMPYHDYNSGFVGENYPEGRSNVDEEMRREAEQERAELYERDAVLRGLDKAAQAVASLSAGDAMAAEDERRHPPAQAPGNEYFLGWCHGRQAALVAIEKARKELAP
jgi:hypothetical protein